MEKTSHPARMGDLSIAAAVTLFGQMLTAYKPNPFDDDPVGPWGPIGPRPWLRHGIAWLNPQPLPPRWAQAASFADQLIAATAGAGDVESGRRSLMLYVDDLCPPPRVVPVPGPFPWPKWAVRDVLAVDLFVIGGRFRQAAARTQDAALADTFAEAAGRLFEAGSAELGG
jgi:hypothetical protein